MPRVVLSLLVLLHSLAFAQIATIEAKTNGFVKQPGFITLYTNGDKIYFELPPLNRDLLYYSSLPNGVGSNDLGLDRGQLGNEKVVQFQRFGNKILLVEVNEKFRAITDNPLERRAVEQSFAQSVLAGFDVAAATGTRLLIDATPFVLRDAHGVATTLKRSRQGDFRLDATRSALTDEYTKAFPKNTEVEVLLTFAGEGAGPYVRDVTPTPEAITVHEHHSFVQLPDVPLKPRSFNPNAGYFGFSYYDYSTPIDQPLIKRFITRHRLSKKDPAAPMSDPVEPIKYYLDPGAPEPIRTALLEGARWWNQAFEAAGYRNAFQVELLPADADPMDVRYNLIQWVHRSTRGWSYGASIIDPRSGEILKGKVTLGSLRVRQDYLIAEGLLSPYASDAVDPRMEQLAIARLHQLAAHEVGHTLGLAHNYIASTRDRSSVMDYPAPLVKLTNGKIDLSDAYAVNIGEWDKVAIKYGYSDFAPGTNEDAALMDILREAWSRNLAFLTDQDARPAGSPHPQNHLWDNGPDAVASLNQLMEVRKVALAQFGANSIRRGQPWAQIEEVLVPLYLLHRYQVEAASKAVAGVDYRYALKGDGQLVQQIVPAGQQRAALQALMKTIEPSALTLPDSLLSLIPPRPPQYPRTRETFPSKTGLTFDPVSAAETAATLTVSMILHPERAERLAQQNARDAKLPSLDEVLKLLRAEVLKPATAKGLGAEVRKRIDAVIVTQILGLAASAESSSVAGTTQRNLKELQAALPATDNAQYLKRMIDRYFSNPGEFKLPPVAEAPPGQPIGDDQ